MPQCSRTRCSSRSASAFAPIVDHARRDDLAILDLDVKLLFDDRSEAHVHVVQRYRLSCPHCEGREGKATVQQQLLRDAFNPGTIEGLMCRHQLHVGHDGTMHDCDFNYALGLPVNGPARHVNAFDPERFRQRCIATGEHCFADTAGCGSSCGGALT